MRLFHRTPPWQDDWTIEIVEAERKSQPGAASAWGWNIIETNWEAMAETARIMSALGDPEQRDRYRAYLNNPEARYVYRSRWGVLDEPDPYPRWYPTEKDARDAATAIADLLWNRFGRLRKVGKDRAFPGSRKTYFVRTRDEDTGIERPCRGDEGEPFTGTLDESKAFVQEWWDLSNDKRTVVVFEVRLSDQGVEEIELGRGAR